MSDPRQPPPGSTDASTIQHSISDQATIHDGSAARAVFTLSPGTRFGPYLVHRLLGSGGMGEVYECEEVESGRRLAVKTLSRSTMSSNARARFLREGRLAAALSHPNTIYLFGSDEIAGIPIIAMELMSGGTLADRVRERGPLPIADAVGAITQIIDGLSAAADAGILHRDIKPANCFIDADGAVKIGDFGLSVSTEAGGETQLTLAQAILGTPAFASPEQLRGDELDVRSDIYSVGATLYFLLSGHAPFEERNLMKLVSQVATEAPKRLRDWQPQVPKSLEAIIAKCLAKKREDRFENYDALAAAIEPYAIAQESAPMVVRGVAYILDGLLGTVVQGPIMLALSWAFPSAFPFDFRSVSLNLLVVDAIFTVVYYGLFEGVWGRTPIKSLLGLRVVAADGSIPGLPLGLARASVFCLPASLVAMGVRAFGVESTTVSGAVALSVALLMMSPARRSNGFQGWHDRLTSTRVVRGSIGRRSPTAQPVAEARMRPSQSAATIGPYAILETPGLVPEGFVAGHDPRLNRTVWIHQAPIGTPPIVATRRDLSRPTRLRWVGGHRGPGERDNWDAYEALDGHPISIAVQTGCDWTHFRYWLYELAHETVAAQSDGNCPGQQLQDAWITRSGRLKLLDGVASDGQATMTPLLVQFARLASSLTLPQHARELLQDIESSRTSVAELTTRLQHVLSKPATVSRFRRVAALAAVAALPLFMSAMWITVAALMLRAGLESGATEVQRHLQLRRQLTTEREDDRRAVDIIIAGRFRDVPQHPALEKFPYLTASQREHIQQILEATPPPSSDALREAERRVAPLLADPVLHGLRPLPIEATLFIFPAATMWVIAAIISLLLALIIRNGLTFRMTELALVTSEGAPATGVRAFARALVAWAPVLAGTALFAWHEWFHDSPNPSAVEWIAYAVFALTFFAGSIAAVLSPSRGWQDRLANTRLVPR